MRSIAVTVYYRKMMRISWMEKGSNKSVLKELGVH